ncbi:UvrD-helicase domain-containing protein [Acanthopleuribacter pedis]|uniref:DEAD/DEAH box helicase n=1 Tax=Acanthopleuribacter pedis TaxID=442870 RepID=A0A8J7U2Y9_9BACT|nr:UvrD-helicase domain-containing protein [Acanthopleuribacter pedis]MBO1319818.1 DEAD/DEAH box helicase [Acanthopleuribacter pedis]
MIQVLINDTVKHYFLKLAPPQRKRLRAKFEYLENGLWDSGLKVKKLKGTSSKTVLEGRLDRGNRIIFTLGREQQAEGDVTLVYVWGVVVHDDIDKKARVVVPDNVPFLKFNQYQEELFESVVLDDLDADYFTQETIADPIDQDAAGQRWHPLGEPEWQRLAKYSHDDFELFLHLTPDQNDILRTPPPLLVSGTAGSGKTTLAVYYLFKSVMRHQKKLFVTYNRYLCDYSRRLYESLLNERDDVADWTPPRFETFKNLCLEIAAEGKQRFPRDKEMDFRRFRRLFPNSPHAAKYEATLVWEEIRAIIKGALPHTNLKLFHATHQRLQGGSLSQADCHQLKLQFHQFARLESAQPIEKAVQKAFKQDLTTFARQLEHHVAATPERVQTVLHACLQFFHKEPQQARRRYLTPFEYESIGRKKAPSFPFDRKQIYAMFDWYQDLLDREGYWDELDLAREVGALLNANEDDRFRFDFVIGDEIQDLTDIQHELLFSWVRNPYNQFLCGDTKQIINPSGFRWEELRRHFFDRDLKVPDPRFLSLNFRSSGAIVEIANTLLHLKQKLLGVRKSELAEDWKFKGRPTLLIRGLSPGRVLQSVAATGANRTILVRNQAEKEKLQKKLDTELVFTISEAKGLEFDTVLLWGFANDSTARDLWGLILKDELEDLPEARIRHDINLLYVGITRARGDLLIYDGEAGSVIWNDPLFARKLVATDDAAFIDTIWNVTTTPEAWRSQGRYFLERGHYRAARECFKNADDQDGFLTASALHYQEEERWEHAAEAFAEVGRSAEAAANFERAEQPVRAMPLYEAVGDEAGVKRCRVAVALGTNRFHEAAMLLLELDQVAEAAALYVRAKAYREAAELYRDRLDRPEQAAVYFEKGSLFAEAAAMFEAGGNRASAAQNYYRAERHTDAERLFRALGDTKGLIRVYQKTKQVEPLLDIFAVKNDFKAAYQAVQHLDEAERIALGRAALAQDRAFAAAILLDETDDHVAAGDAFMLLKNYDEAADHFREAGDFRRLVDALIPIDLAAALRTLPKLSEADLAAVKVHDLLSILCVNDPKACEAVSGEWLAAKRDDLALIGYEAIGDHGRQGIIHANYQRWDQMRQAWLQMPLYQLPRAYTESLVFDKLPIFFRFLINDYNFGYHTNQEYNITLNYAEHGDLFDALHDWLDRSGDPRLRRKWRDILYQHGRDQELWTDFLRHTLMLGEHDDAAAYLQTLIEDQPKLKNTYYEKLVSIASKLRKANPDDPLVAAWERLIASLDL